MKKIIFVTLLLLATLFTFSQKNKDKYVFGKVDKAELEMKVCDYDKAAEAMVLFDLGETFCYQDGRVEFFKHIRIKVFNDKGKNQADIKIPFVPGSSDLKNLTAQVYNLDEAGNIVVTKVEKDLFLKKSVTKRTSELIFAFPNLKAGSVFEYKYKQELFPNYWYFQKSIPVKFSEFKLDFPAEIIVSAQIKGVLPVVKTEGTKANNVLKTYVAENLPALRDEPFITCDEDYLTSAETQLIAFDVPGAPRKNLTRNWPQIVRILMEDEDFGVQLKRNLPSTADLDAALKNAKNEYDKMVTIHNYVRKNMQWNEYYGIWALDGVRSAWKDKKGSTGEINLILINLLKDAGLHVQPMLVKKIDNGQINMQYPSFGDFDKVVAYVIIGNNFYIMDATDKYTPPTLIPRELIYSEGLAISKIETFEWGWKHLNKVERTYNNLVYLNSTIDEKGKMNGSATISSTDYARLVRLPKLAEGKDKFKEAYFTSTNDGAKVENLEFENEENDTLPLIQKFEFTKSVNNDGTYMYFTPNMFTGLEKNPFVAESRFSDVFYGANQKYTIIANFTIPDGYAFEELPKNMRMIMPDTSISFSKLSSVTDQTLSSRITIEFKKPFFTPEEYPDFHEFYKKLFELLNEAFVIKKK